MGIAPSPRVQGQVCPEGGPGPSNFSLLVPDTAFVIAEAFRLPVLLEQPTRIGESPIRAELEAVGRLGLDFRRSGRVAALSSIAGQLGVPAGGWPASQSRLFERGDARLLGLCGLLSRSRMAARVATNLASAARFGDVSVMLTLVTAQREHGTALYAAGTQLVDSFWQGGLDHLWAERHRLGLPRSVVDQWKPVGSYPNPDAHVPASQRAPDVEPARIPARDQLMIYAAQINASFQRFRGRLSSLGVRAVWTRVGATVWQALCFLAPGGAHFQRGASLTSQIGQRFGAQSILEYLVGTSSAQTIDLDRVFGDPELNKSAWIKSAKVRATECLFSRTPPEHGPGFEIGGTLIGMLSHGRLALLAMAVACGAGSAGQAATTESVRDRDWKNGDYDLGNGRFAFVAGRHADLADDGSCSECLTIREVTFGDVDGDGAEEAILLIDSNLGGAATSLDGYVFGLAAGKAVLKAQIQGGDRGEGGLQSVSVGSGEVIVRRFDLAPTDGACCPSRVLVERWRWRDGHLVKAPGPPAVRKRKPRAWFVRP